MSRLIITDNYPNPQRNRPAIKRLAAQVFASRLRRDILQTVDGADKVTVLTGDLMADRLADLDRITVRTYGQVFHEALARTDGKALLDFAQALRHVMEGGVDGGGVSCRDVSVFSIWEFRLLSFLLYNFTPYVEAICGAIEDVLPTSIQVLTDRSALERLAREIGSLRPGTAIEKRASTAAFLWSSLRDHSVPSQAALPPVRNWFRLFPTQPALDSYDTLGTPRVLLVAYDERRVRRFPPIAAALNRVGGFYPCLLVVKKDSASGVPDLIEEYRRQGVACSFATDWLSTRDATQCAELAALQVGKAWRNVEMERRFGLAHTYRGISILAHCHSPIKDLWLKDGIWAALVAEATYQLLQRVRPSLVVTLDESEVSRATVLHAKRLGIPSLLYLPNAVLPDSHVQLAASSCQRDWLAVASEHARDRFAALTPYGLDRITVAGDVFGDSASTISREVARAEVCRALGLDVHKRIVVLLSTYVTPDISRETKRLFFRRVFEAVHRLAGVQMIVKAHPNESLEMLRGEMAEWGCQSPVVQSCDLRDLCASADLVCMIYSQAGVEAMSLGTPVVAIQPREQVASFDALLPYVRGGGASYVADDEDATPVFRELLEDPVVRMRQVETGKEFAVRYMGPLDGRSSERLARRIAEIVSGSFSTDRGSA